MVRYVERDAVPDIWPRVFQHVASACDETLTPRDIYDRLMGNQARMFVVEGADDYLATCVTWVKEARGNRWLEVVTIGADDGRGFDDWCEDLQHVLEVSMEFNGCNFMRCYARPGLARKLRPLGWRQRQVTTEWRRPDVGAEED